MMQRLIGDGFSKTLVAVWSEQRVSSKGFENGHPLNFRCTCHRRSPAHNRSISSNERQDTLDLCIKSIWSSHVLIQLPRFPFGCYTNPDPWCEALEAAAEAARTAYQKAFQRWEIAHTAVHQAEAAVDTANQAALQAARRQWAQQRNPRLFAELDRERQTLATLYQGGESGAHIRQKYIVQQLEKQVQVLLATAVIVAA